MMSNLIEYGFRDGRSSCHVQHIAVAAAIDEQQVRFVLRMSCSVLPQDLTNVFQIGNTTFSRGGGLAERAVPAYVFCSGMACVESARPIPVHREYPFCMNGLVAMACC